MLSPVSRIVDAESHVRAVIGERYVVDDRVCERQILTLREIQELAAANLSDPDMEDPVAIGEKGREFSVGRNRGIELITFPVRETRETRASERASPEVVVADHLPR